MKYHSTVEIPQRMSLEDVRAVIEMIRGSAGAEIASRDDLGLPQTLIVSFEAQDGWELYQVVRELEQDIFAQTGDKIDFPKPTEVVEA